MNGDDSSRTGSFPDEAIHVIDSTDTVVRDANGFIRSGDPEVFGIERDDVRTIDPHPVSGCSPAEVFNARQGKVAGRIIPNPEQQCMTGPHQDTPTQSYSLQDQ